MARLFTDGSTEHLRNADGSAALNINSNINILALVRPASLLASRQIFVVGLAGNRGYGLSMQNTSGHLNFVKVSVADVTGTATTALSANTWFAVMGFSTSGGNAHFKRLNLGTGELATETVTSTDSINAPTAGDDVLIGNWLGPTTTLVWPGRIARVAVVQASQLSDGEFRTWAYTGRLPRAALFDCHVLGRSPEMDYSGNAIAMTVTGTSIADHAPVGPMFGFDYGIPIAVGGAAPADQEPSLVGGKLVTNSVVLKHLVGSGR